MIVDQYDIILSLCDKRTFLSILDDMFALSYPRDNSTIEARQMSVVVYNLLFHDTGVREKFKLSTGRMREYLLNKFKQTSSHSTRCKIKIKKRKNKSFGWLTAQE